MTATADLPTNAPSPRLCHIVKWPDFEGYGFNLHADKTRPGQYIGKVDENSPADVAGLREGDRIIEVNGVNISNENHKQVVQRIKAVSNETKLLVVDGEADRWYKSHNLVVRGDQSNIIHGSSKKQQEEDGGEAPPPTTHTTSPKEKTPSTPVESDSNSRVNEDDNKSVESSSSSHSEQSTQPQDFVKGQDHEIPSVDSLALEENASDSLAETAYPLEIPTIEVDAASIEFSNEVDESCPPKSSSSSSVVVDQCSAPQTSDNDSSKSSDDGCTAPEQPITNSSCEQSEVQTGGGEPLQEDKPSVEDPLDSDFALEYDNIRFELENSDRVNAAAAATEEERRSASSHSSNEETASATKPDGGAKGEGQPEAEDQKSPMSTTPSPPPSLNTEGGNSTSRDSPTQNSSPTVDNRGLNLNMTAAEMRAHLATKKKFDPRKDTIDLKKKYQIVQNM